VRANFEAATAEEEIDRLRGALREALAYAERDDESELMAKIWQTCHSALNDAAEWKHTNPVTVTHVHEMEKEDLWRLIYSLMTQLREKDAWQESVNVTRRADRARADKAEAQLEAVMGQIEHACRLLKLSGQAAAAATVLSQVERADEFLPEWAQKKPETPSRARRELEDVAEQITRELICCDEFEKHKDDDDPRAVRHEICYWAAAARALVLDRVTALEIEESRDA
jgi:hypothetical protein